MGPLCFRTHKVKSHRAYSDAVDLTDLYTILGNTLADETAKIINKQDIDSFREAAEAISLNSKRQMAALELV